MANTSGNWIVTVKCQHCNGIYQLMKQSKPSVGQVTNPNPGLKCTQCGKACAAIVVAVAPER